MPKEEKSVLDKQGNITDRDVEEFESILEEYRTAKQMIDHKATVNQEWWRMRHWQQMASDGENEEEKSTSAWLFNSIINKHADIMDNYPRPNILPRSPQMEQEAKMLSEIIPIIDDRNDYERIYDSKAYDLLIDGGCVTSVLWDNTLNGGMGDIVTRIVDVHNIFWEPGIEDIQDSAYVFVSKMVDNDTLERIYPQMEGKTGGTKITTEYINKDETPDPTKKSEVWDMYYKKTVKTVAMATETGEKVERIDTLLHFVKFCNGVLLYASENDPQMKDRGWYDHGKYPFVVTPLFKIKESPWGFGYVDVMKSPQAQIDRLDQLILKNSIMVGQKRWAVKESADINPDDFADWSKQLIPVSGAGDLNEAIKEITVDSIPAFVVQHKTNMIDQLKETSGNRDVSQGSTQSGVTAATAIAALQEAGSKLSRDINRVLYRSRRDEDYLKVELIRQFYTEPRSFRIDNNDGSHEFVRYDSTAIRDADGEKGAVFDIKINAEKQSPFSRAAQNETMKELYGMGLFAPANAEPALTCLDGMEFEGIDKIKEEVKQKSLMMQQFQMMQATIMQLDAMFPQLGIAASAGLAAQQPIQGMPQRASTEEGTAEERAARTETDSTRTAKARVAAGKQAQVG